MELLKRQKSSKLLNLEALMRRLSGPETGDFYFYQEMYVTQKKGYDGEVCVDQVWSELDILSPFAFLHGFETINDAGRNHQIDTLVLTPYFIWILEIKNIGGRIDIDESKHQLIRTNPDGIIESFRNPINQIKRHARLISSKLIALKMSLPVESSIIIVSDYTIIGTIPAGISIFHASGLQIELDKLFNKHREPKISLDQFERLKTGLLNMHQRKNWKAKVEVGRLRKGVLCKNCDYRNAMLFEFGKFKCMKCGNKSKDAYLEALLDYRYLWSEWITNSELREYLGIESRYSVNRLLKDLNLEYQGTYRNRKYRIPDFFE